MNREELNKLFDEHFIDDCKEVYDSQNEIVDFAEKAVKLFAISVVSNRRELLIAFQSWQFDKGYLYQKNLQNGMIEEFLKSNL